MMRQHEAYIVQKYPDMMARWKEEYQQLALPEQTEEAYLQDRLEDAWLMIQIVRKGSSED